jgi:hypothetical protein
MTIRDLTSAAQTRQDVRMRAQQMDPGFQDVNGGLWGTSILKSKNPNWRKGSTIYFERPVDMKYPANLNSPVSSTTQNT